MIDKVIDLFRKLLYVLSRQQKLLGCLVIIASLVTAAFELLGVSVVAPFIRVILKPEEIRNWRFFGLFDSIDDKGLLLIYIAGVIFVYFVKNFVFIVNAWMGFKFSYKVQREVSVRMVSSYLRRGYRFFLNNNINELLQGSVGDVMSLYGVISATLQVITQSAIILSILVYMIYIDWQIAMEVVLSSGFCLCVVMLVFRNKMLEAGKEVRRISIECSKTLHDAFYGIKEVMVMDKREYYIDEYRDKNIEIQRAQIKKDMGSAIPAYLIEAVCVAGIMSVLGVRIMRVSDQGYFVSVLASFAIGAFRILPGIGKISSSVNAIMSYIPGVNAVYENVCAVEKYEKLNTNMLVTSSLDDDMTNSTFDKIELNNISFAYDRDRYGYVLQNVFMTINMGESVALIGETGAGKSTMGDIILGLLPPDRGSVCIGGTDIRKIPKHWAKLIGFVPQTIYLSDTTIRNNVAFGEKVDQIDDNKVKVALEKANILSFIEKLPEGMYTEIGDRGVRLSGGQRQRIGIARALYHNPSILVLDEATSALDNETERVIMETIDSLRGRMTMIIIAHRLSTIRNCDRIYEIVGGKAIERDYQEIV